MNEKRQQLIDARQMFEDVGDWEEVSKLQYEIDNLPIEKEEPKLEPWFLAALAHHTIKMMRRQLANDIHMMRKLIRLEEEDA